MLILEVFFLITGSIASAAFGRVPQRWFRNAEITHSTLRPANELGWRRMNISPISDPLSEKKGKPPWKFFDDIKLKGTMVSTLQWHSVAQLVLSEGETIILCSVVWYSLHIFFYKNLCKTVDFY